MSKILPWLYLGSKVDSLDLNFLIENDISVIINVAVELQTIVYPKEVITVKVPLHDSDTEDISMYFEYIHRCLELARLLKQKVLIHCYAGISRSSTFVVYYLMKVNQWTLYKTLGHVRKTRKQVRPNDNFLSQLNASSTGQSV